MKKIFLTFSFALTSAISVPFATSIPLHAQSVVNALYEATVTDAKTGAAVDVQYTITTVSSGKKKTGKVSASKGGFQEILKPGETYTITLYEYNIFKTTETFSIPPATKYTTHKGAFKVRLMAKGEQIFAESCFQPNQSHITNELKFNELIELLRENRSLEVALSIAPDGKFSAPPKPKSAPKPAKGKKSEPVAPQTDSPAASLDAKTALAQDRIAAIKKLIEAKDASLLKQVQFIVATVDQKPNVVCTIAEVVNKFK